MFVLDTDHIAIIQRQTQPEYAALVRQMAAHPVTEFFFTVVSFHEQALGANKYVSQARTTTDAARGYAMFQRILTDFAAAQVLPFDGAAAQVFDDLRSQRVRIPTMDLRIASIALARGMTVLTRNLRDFRQVPGLTVDDWTI
jgi:tRNA(fMet)-specific endonuclease VapC